LGRNEFNGWSYINTLENVKIWLKNTNKAQLRRHYNPRYMKDSRKTIKDDKLLGCNIKR